MARRDHAMHIGSRHSKKSPGSPGQRLLTSTPGHLAALAQLGSVWKSNSWAPSRGRRKDRLAAIFRGCEGTTSGFRGRRLAVLPAPLVGRLKTERDRCVARRGGKSTGSSGCGGNGGERACRLQDDSGAREEDMNRVARDEGPDERNGVSRFLRFRWCWWGGGKMPSRLQNRFLGGSNR